MPQPLELDGEAGQLTEFAQVAARGVGDPLQRRAVGAAQFAARRVGSGGGVVLVAAPARGHRAAVGGPRGDGEDEDAGVGRRVEGIVQFAAEVLAVRDQHDRLRRGGVLDVEQAQGGLQGVGEVGARPHERGLVLRARNQLAHGLQIERERGALEGVAAEGDEADAVAAEVVEQLVDRRGGGGGARGLHVPRRHRARDVEGDRDVDAEARERAFLLAPLWASDGDDDEHERAEQQQILQRAPPGDAPSPQRGSAAEGVVGLAPPPCGVRCGEQHRQQDRQPEQRQRIGEGDHGYLLKVVARRPASAASSSSAAAASSGPYSRNSVKRRSPMRLRSSRRTSRYASESSFCVAASK